VNAVEEPDSADVLNRVHGHLDLVDLIARQVARSLRGAIEFDDLIGVGREGLLHAARRFDPARGVQFRTYASVRIRGAMFDGVRQTGNLPRRVFQRLRALEAASDAAEGAPNVHVGELNEPGNAETAIKARLASTATACAAAVLHAFGGPAAVAHAQELATEQLTPEEAYARAELYRRLKEGLEELKVPSEAEILRLHYFEGLTFEAIGQRMVLERSWVGRLHGRALHKLFKRFHSSP
jgi:RNA polymerase sigma factor FliA